MNSPGRGELGGRSPGEEHLVKHVLDPLRELAGSPISVNSGYRSAAVNAAVGGSKTSDHMKGLAADIVVGPKPRVWLTGWGPERLARVIAESDLPFDQVIWEPTWVHVSWRWSPRRQVLKKVGSDYAIWSPS